MSESENQKEQFNSALTELQKILETAQKTAADIEALNQSTQQKIAALEEKNSGAQEMFDFLKEILVDADEKKASVNNYLEDINRKSQEIYSIKEKLSISADDFYNRINEKINEVDGSIAQLRTETASIKESIDAEIPNFRQRVESEQAALRQQIESEQTSLRQGIVSEQATLRQKLEEISTSFQIKYTEQQEQRSKEFLDKINELQELSNNKNAKEIKVFEDIIETLKKDSGDVIEKLTRYESQAKQVLGTVIATSQAGIYKIDAEAEKRSKVAFRISALFFMICAVITLLYMSYLDITTKGAPNTLTDWHDWLKRLFASVPFIVPAYYCARESTRHSNNERKSKRLEQILSTISLFRVAWRQKRRIKSKTS